jgi:chromosome partitioning protein
MIPYIEHKYNKKLQQGDIKSMCKIIACVNEKGGVAKTTTIKNISIGLAQKGKKVLVIDLDPSSNLTNSLGITEKSQGTILDILRRSDRCEEIPMGYAVLHQEEGIDFICSTESLHDFESEITCAIQRETVLRRYLVNMKDHYDYIFIDCPAGLGIYVTNALFASDAVIIPVQPQFLGAGAMQNLFKFIKKVRMLNGTNVKPEILGILFTMVRTNTNNDKGLIDYFKETYCGKINIFETLIPNSVRFSESDGEGQSIFKYAPKTSAAMVYGDLVNEILEYESIQRGDNYGR